MTLKIISLALFVTLIGSHNPLFSQCKYKKNEVDKFTKKVYLETTDEILNRDFSGVIAIGFIKTDTNTFVKLVLNLSNQVYTISKGDKLIFLIKDHTVELNASESKVANSYCEMTYPLSPENLNILKQNRITDIRIELKDSKIDKSIDEKKANKVMALSNCVN
jgi:hypothetical protein